MSRAADGPHAANGPHAEDGPHVDEIAALVALLRSPRRPASHYPDLLGEAGNAKDVLAEEQGVLAADLMRTAKPDVLRWMECGLSPRTVLDVDYPESLRAVHDRPPLLFIAGSLLDTDERSVAVIGSRRASAAGIQRAHDVTQALIAAGYTIVSGLALGIDATAHRTALDQRARTIAVVGTGLFHSYPRQNAPLQNRIAIEGAVVSQFWPEEGPLRDNFPKRNAVMSGLSLATVIVEATHTSGARIQARRALNHGRPVVLLRALLSQPWARELSERPGVHVAASPAEVPTIVDRASTLEAPVA